MKLLISGAGGMVGTRLVALAQKAGYQTLSLVRRPAQGANERFWDPVAGTMSAEVLDGVDVVVHLAGENIGTGRWTSAKKQRIQQSRVQGTLLLAQTIAQHPSPPKTFVCASAIGYYGDRGDESLTEQSSHGSGFLAATCVAWEQAAKPARERGIRVTQLRLGVVLGREGGALQKMLLPFWLGVGGIIGNGRQSWSWLSVDEAASLFLQAATDERFSGPINAVTPHPVTNYEFTKTLGKVLRRPTLFPLPAFMARLALGEMADALILSSTRVLPTRLQELGYQFQHPDLEGALRHVLRSKSS